MTTRKTRAYAFAGPAAWQGYAFQPTVRGLDPAPLHGIRPGQDNHG